MSQESYHFMVFLWKSIRIGSLFTSRFWQSFQNAMGTHLSFSIAFHPQSSGQVERVNQILEDMLRACVISFGKNWEKYLPFAEFAYNNSYQSSLNMAPFEFLYGRRCRTPLNWSENGKDNSLDQIWSRKQKSKFALFVIVWKPPNLVKELLWSSS